MEKVASDAECLLRLAEDGTVSAGNLEGLVSRVIDLERTTDSSKDERFGVTFLTIYQLFSTSVHLFEILKRRFEAATKLDPIDTRSQYSILLFIENWLKKGFEDEGLSCSSKIREFVLAIFESSGQELKTKAAEIASMIYNPDYVYLRQPRGIVWLRRKPTRPPPPRVRPSDLAAALSAVAGDWYRRITYWDYVNFIRPRLTARRIELFKSVHDKVTEWVQRSIMKPGYVEERAKMFESWVYTAEECRAMNDFSSASAIVTALMSAKVAMLVLACEKQTMQIINTLNRDLAQSSGAYYDTLRQTGTKELIPWLDPHLSTLNSTLAHSNPIVEVDGHHLIDFKLCSELAGQIDSIAQYSPPPVSSKIRPDVLEYVEYHLQSGLILKDLHHAAAVAVVSRGATTRHSGKEPRRLTTLTKRETRKSLGGLWPPPHHSHQSHRADMTTQRPGRGGDTGGQRRGAMALSLPHEKNTTRTRGERMARQREEEKARRMRKERIVRRDGADMAQWREDMVRWREDMERWRKDTRRWGEDDARQAEKDLGGLREEDVSMQPRRKGVMSRLFRETIVMVCNKVL